MRSRFKGCLGFALILCLTLFLAFTCVQNEEGKADANQSESELEYFVNFDQPDNSNDVNDCIFYSALYLFFEWELDRNDNADWQLFNFNFKV